MQTRVAVISMILEAGSDVAGVNALLHEFAPRLRFLWDANADRYLRYETMYYAMGLVRERLQEYA